MIRDAGDVLTKALLCSPCREYARVSGLARHNMTQVPDPEKAKSQHTNLRAILQKHGCQVIDLAELKGHPNSVFTADPICATPFGFIQLRMGLKSRRGEEEWLACALRSVGQPHAGKIHAPGTAEGGDIILAGSVAFLGRSTRTNDRGITQLRTLLEPFGYEVRIADVPPPFLHLGGAMTVVAPGLVLCCRDVFSEAFLRGFKRIEIAATGFVSGNVIALGNKRTIVETRNLAAQKALAEHGFTVSVADLSEFIKGNGGPSCLIMAFEREATERDRRQPQ